MLYLNPNKERILTFEVEINGVSKEEINGYVRFFIEGMEYGFPVAVEENKIFAQIKPLKELVNTPLKNGTIINARLDLLTTDQEFFSPWQDEIEIRSPISVEAKLSDNDKQETSNSKSKFSVKALVEDQFDEIINKTEPLIEKKTQTKTNVVSKPKPVKESISKPIPKPVEKKTELPKKKPITETKKVSVDALKNITQEGVYAYMTRAGSKNPTIQEIIYNQAMQKAGSSKPFDVLKEVVKILNRKSDFSNNMNENILKKMMEKQKKN